MLSFLWLHQDDCDNKAGRNSSFVCPNGSSRKICVLTKGDALAIMKKEGGILAKI